jgi:hypothetical protein
MTAVSADTDVEAREALWKAIRKAADDVRYRFKIGSIRSQKGAEITPKLSLPDVKTWRLMEALSLLTVIQRSEKASARVIDVFAKTGPIEIRESGADQYLWAQQTLYGVSALRARP